jgi:hypothetical protein
LSTTPSGIQKLMKFSVLLVSVNIAATLPLAVAGSALANDGASSDKVDWLKSSLASLDTSASQKKPRARKISYSQPTPDINGKLVLHSNGVRLRPFVPGRKLPTQHDLDVQFIAQTAKLAAEESPNLSAMTPRMAPGPLTGQVSDSYATPFNASVDTYGSVGYVKQSTSRVAPGQIPAVQGQIRQFRSPAKRNTYVSQPVRALDQSEIASQPQPFRMTMPPVIPASPMQQALQMPPPAMPLAPTTPEPGQSQQVGLSPEEQAIIDRMEANAQARGAAIEMNGQESATMPTMGSSAGPPPFPLNLLPQDSLKSMIGGMHHSHTSVPQAYFGSWHGNSMASLPTGSFHSYAGHSAPKHAAAPHAAGAHSATHSKASVHTAMAPPKHAVESSHTIGQLRRLAPHEPQVASYANYPRFGSTSAIAY